MAVVDMTVTFGDSLTLERDNNNNITGQGLKHLDEREQEEDKEIHNLYIYSPGTHNHFDRHYMIYNLYGLMDATLYVDPDYEHMRMRTAQ